MMLFAQNNLYNDKVKSELIKSGIIANVSKLFYFNSDVNIFSLSCSILKLIALNISIFQHNLLMMIESK